MTDDEAIIKRIARALARADGRDPDAPNGRHNIAMDRYGPLVWHLYTIEANHALAAHRVLKNWEQDKP